MLFRSLNDTEAALNDTANGVGQLMTSMFSAAETLAANPANQALRTTFLYNINEVVTAFQQTANDLQALSESVGSAGSISISAINDALTELTRVNEGLRKVESGTSAEAQLLDSRDAALSTLSNQLDVKISFGDRGTVALQYDGVNIVQDQVAGSFAVAQNGDGTLALTLNGSAVSSPSGGTLGGLFTSARVVSTRVAERSEEHPSELQSLMRNSYAVFC